MPDFPTKTKRRKYVLSGKFTGLGKKRIGPDGLPEEVSGLTKTGKPRKRRFYNLSGKFSREKLLVKLDKNGLPTKQRRKFEEIKA